MVLDCLERRIRKMDVETKKWLTFDHSAEDKESLLKQVAENEAKTSVTTQSLSEVPTMRSRTG